MNVTDYLGYNDDSDLDGGNVTSKAQAASSFGPSFTEIIIICSIMFVFSILGIVGNAFAFLIYYRKRDKGTSTIFILSLAVTDFITCLIMIPFSMTNELLLYKLSSQFFCKVFMFLQTHLILLSSFIMVGIGIDRYFCICHPFLRVVTVPRAKIILVLMVILSSAICIIPCFFYSVYQQRTFNETIIVYNSTYREVLIEDSDSDELQVPLNITRWISSLSDAVLPTEASGGQAARGFPYGASPPPGYISASSAASLSPGGIQGTTASPPSYYTNGLFLEPARDFLDSIAGSGKPTLASPSQSRASSLLAASLTFLNTSTVLPSVESSTNAAENASYIVYEMVTREIYTGYCYQTYAVLPKQYLKYYQRFHASIFLVEFIILALLYILIYNTILVRRAWKAKRRRMSGYASTVNGKPEETQLTHINANATVNPEGGDAAPGLNGNGESQPSAETGLLNQRNKDPAAGRVSAAMRDRAFYANIRTAAMLFVVTVVFVISFMPSWFMGLKFLKFNIIVFYMFYINNVVNPIIYAFMNRAFRDDLVQLLKGCLRR
ncbi:orexin receptor type 2 [Elysia marginata]|uniref:Orexin receptor type 2 n=1 Tax=Elysia marginata TaxID=1093978 RepID=A0AAV4FE06_9GAST|nr:orexin receptor type 2 [Elysia marginata]